MTSSNRFVTKVIAQPLRPRVVHYWGAPPDLTEGVDLRERMPIAAALLIRTNPDGVFLFRLGADGQVVGDTWHRSVDEAREQAEFEFGSGLSDWIVLPPGETDPLSFVLGIK